MYLLEFNNHKVLRIKNVTYSELVRFLPLPCPSHCLSLLLRDSYKAERMQLPAYIGRESMSLQPITATGFALNVRQQQHLPPPPTAPPKYTSQRKLSEKQRDPTEERLLPRLTLQCPAFSSRGSIHKFISNECLSTCSPSVLRTLGHFCWGCCNKSSCFDPLLWNIITRKKPPTWLKYHSSDCKLLSRYIAVELTSSDKLYPTFCSFSL